MDKKLKLNIFSTAAVLTAFFAFSVPQDSLAWFDDLETAETNALSASTLEFSASPVNDLPAGGIAPYEDYIHTLNLTKIGTLDFNYSITLGNFDDGVNDGSGLCDNLTIKDDIPGSTTVYPIKDYILNLASYPADTSINFTIRLVSNDPSLQNQTCKFDYKITAWQTDMIDYSTGFSDQKLVSDSILSDPWEVEPAQGGGQGDGENYEGGEGTNGSEENNGDIEGGTNDGNGGENDEESDGQEQQIEKEEIKIEEPEETIIPAENEGGNGPGGNEGDESGNNNANGETGNGQNENPETE